MNLQLPKKKARVVLEAVVSLERMQLVDPAVAESIRRHIEPIPFDWRRLARYSFVAALVCLVISILTAVFDEVFVRWFERMLPLVRRLFQAPPAARAAGLAALAGAIFWLGTRRRVKAPERVFTNETLFSLGAAAVAACAYTLWTMPVLHSHGPLLTAGLAVVLGALGITFASKVIWAYALLTFAGAIGSGTEYSMGGYYLWEEAAHATVIKLESEGT